MTSNNNQVNNKEPKRRFKGVWIPKELWVTKELSLTEKFLFLEIDSYVDEDEGYCYATNGHFAKFLQLKKSRISMAIKSLSEKGMVKIENVMNGKELIRRKLFVTNELKGSDVRQAPAQDETDPELRQFRGIWIPANIWLNTSLTFTEKAMLAEIESLQHPTRGCYASNPYFASHFGLTRKWVSDVISRLHHAGFVSVIQIRDGLRTVERQVFIKDLNAVMPSDLTEMSGSIEQGEEGVQSNRTPLHSNRTPLQSSRTTPSIQPEQKESLRKPEKESDIDTRPAAQVCQSDVEVGQVEEKVGQAKDFLEKQQSEGEADSSIDFKEIMIVFNKIFEGTLKPVQKLTKADQHNLIGLNNLHAFEKIKTGAGAGAVTGAAEVLFREALACPFLAGENERGWKADFSWIIAPDHAEAILEGRYKPKKTVSSRWEQATKEADQQTLSEMIAKSMSDY